MGTAEALAAAEALGAAEALAAEALGAAVVGAAAGAESLRIACVRLRASGDFELFFLAAEQLIRKVTSYSVR